MFRSIITFLLILITTFAFADENDKAATGADLAEIRQLKSEITGNIEILKGKNMDLENFSPQVQRLEKVIENIEKNESPEQRSILLDLAKLEARHLLRESKALVVYTKRLDLLYLMMATFGALVILSILIYSIIMYTRRSSPEE